MLKKTLAMLLALIVWSLTLGRGIGTFGPATDINNVEFNSDSAIPVLMSNDIRPLTPYNLYYYGADRWGAWPFLLTRVVAESGYRWTDQTLFAVQAVWIFAGALVLSRLGGSGWKIAGLAYLLALCLHREARYLLFELSQVYGWQLTGVLLAWLSCRYVIETSVQGRSRLVTSGGGVLLFTTTFLAIWSSVASAIFLAFLVALETLRAWFRMPPTSRRRILIASALSLCAIVAALFLEYQVKATYRAYAQTQPHGTDVVTNFAIDWGYLRENLGWQLGHIARLAWWPLYLLPAVAGLLSVRALCSRQRVASFVSKASALASDDLVVVAAGAYGLAIINFVLAVVVSHVRLNGYDDRYLTLTNLFGPIAGMVTVCVGVHWLAMRANRGTRTATTAILTGGTALLLLAFPRAHTSLDYVLTKDTARALARMAPGRVVMGGYWEAYVFPALQLEGAMTPAPFEGEINRTPWTVAAVRGAHEIVSCFPRKTPNEVVSPPKDLVQYARRFRLVDGAGIENTRYVCVLYQSAG